MLFVKRKRNLNDCAESGSAIVETAIALPPAVLLIVFLIDIGRLMHNHHVLTQILNDSLLYGISLPGWDVSSTVDPIRNVTENDSKTTLHATRLVATDTRLSIAGNPTIAIDYVTPVGLQPTVSGQITAQYNSLFPIIGPRTIRITGQAEVKND